MQKSLLHKLLIKKNITDRCLFYKRYRFEINRVVQKIYLKLSFSYS